MKGKLKQCCSCEKVFYNFAKPSKDCLCPHCKSGNWVYGYIDENLKCEVCGKSKADVRFEGSEEKNICDSCLLKEKKPKTKIIYHIFTDGRDEYTESKKEALKIYKAWCKEYDNVRLWTMEDDGEELTDLNWVKGQGEFPQ